MVRAIDSGRYLVNFRLCDHCSAHVENAVIDLEKWIWPLLEMSRGETQAEAKPG